MKNKKVVESGNFTNYQLIKYLIHNFKIQKKIFFGFDKIQVFLFFGFVSGITNFVQFRTVGLNC